MPVGYPMNSNLFPSGSTGRGGFIPPSTPFSNQWPAPDVMTPSRVREIVREELRAQSATLLHGATPVRLEGRGARDDEQLRRFIGLELQKYSVDINEQQLHGFIHDVIRNEMKKDGVRHMSQADWLDIKGFVDKKVVSLERQIEITPAEIEKAVGKSLIVVVDERIRAAFGHLSRLITQV